MFFDPLIAEPLQRRGLLDIKLPDAGPTKHGQVSADAQRLAEITRDRPHIRPAPTPR